MKQLNVIINNNLSCQPNNLNKNNVYKSLFGWWQNVDMAFFYMFSCNHQQKEVKSSTTGDRINHGKKTEQDLWKSVRV